MRKQFAHVPEPLVFVGCFLLLTALTFATIRRRRKEWGILYSFLAVAAARLFAALNWDALYRRVDWIYQGVDEDGEECPEDVKNELTTIAGVTMAIICMSS